MMVKAVRLIEEKRVYVYKTFDDYQKHRDSMEGRGWVTHWVSFTGQPLEGRSGIHTEYRRQTEPRSRKKNPEITSSP